MTARSPLTPCSCWRAGPRAEVSRNDEAPVNHGGTVQACPQIIQYGIDPWDTPQGADVRSPPRRVAPRGSSQTVFRAGICGCGPGDPSTPAIVPNAAAMHPIPPSPTFRPRAGLPGRPAHRKIAGVSDLDRATALGALEA